jgi:hypothetical protein
MEVRADRVQFLGPPTGAGQAPPRDEFEEPATAQPLRTDEPGVEAAPESGDADVPFLVSG